MINATMPERPLTLAEAAEHFRVSPRKLRELVRQYHPRVLKAGRAILFDLQAMNDLTDAMRDDSILRTNQGKIVVKHHGHGAAAQEQVRVQIENILREQSKKSRK